MTWVTTHSDRDPLRFRLTSFAPAQLVIALGERLARRRREAAARHWIAQLLPEQLTDVGLDRVFQSVPVDEARLIAALMFIR